MVRRLLFQLVLPGLASSSAFLAGCHKNPPANTGRIPPPSQAGVEMMACYLDSTPWVIQQVNSTGLEFGAGEGTNDTFSIAGYPILGVSPFGTIQYLELIMFGQVEAGMTYSVTDNNHIIFWYSPDSTCAGFNDRDIPIFTPSSGTVTITKLDGKTRIMSGLFNAKFAIPGCDTVTFSQGWFDFKF